MKNFKLSRKVPIALTTLFVFAVGTIIVGLLSNDKAMAVLTSCDKGHTGIILQGDGNRQHGYFC